MPRPVLSEWNHPGSRERFIERIVSLAEVLLAALFGSILAQGAFVILNLSPFGTVWLLFLYLMGETAATLLLIALVLRARHESWSSLGLTSAGISRALGNGLLLVPALFAATCLVALFFRVLLPAYSSTGNPLLEMVRTPLDLGLFLVTSLLAGGVKEEVQRAFILVRFERHLGGTAVGLTVWSVFFALLHQVQGVDKAVAAGVLGFLFGLLYVRSRRLAGPIAAHAAYDVITLLAFWTFFRS
jgi:membrane protease YdiL (CAAX protease family)